MLARFVIWRFFAFIAALSFPLYWLYLAVASKLGPDPGKTLLDHLGLGSLVLLLIVLSLTPLFQVTRWSGWTAIRRQLGLWCFFYALLHVMSYITFILNFEWLRIFIELQKRPYIIVGFISFIGLLVLSLTSNRASQRYLKLRWKKLHRLTYIILMLALLHMLWVVRADLAEWLVYAVIGSTLLVLRLPFVKKNILRVN